MSKETRFS